MRANQRNAPEAPLTSASIALRMVPPPSRASISASSAELASMRSAMAFSFSARSWAGVEPHGPSSKARRAASMAATASSRVPLATSATFSPVPGL